MNTDITETLINTYNEIAKIAEIAKAEGRTTDYMNALTEMTKIAEIVNA